MRFLIGLLCLSLTAGGCLTTRLPEARIVQTADQAELTWMEIARKALDKNPDILNARAQADSAVIARSIAAGDYLPSVDAGLTKTRRSPGEPADGLSVGISARQNFFSGFGTTGNLLNAQKTAEAAQWFYYQTSADVRFRLRSVYVELLRLERLLDVSRRISERREQNAELIRLRYDAGREHLGSSMRAEAIVSQAEFEVRQTERRIQSQSIRLGRELGGEFALFYEMTGLLEELLPQTGEAPDFVQLAEASPQVQRLIKTAEAAKAAVITAQSEVWPQVDGGFDYAYAGERASELQKESLLSLQVNLPLFEGGQNVNEIRRARENYEAAREAARSNRDEIVTQLSETWVRLVDAVEQVAVRKNFLDAARKRSEIVRTQYSSGLSTFQEFDIAESELADAEKAYVQSLADALTREAEWKRVQGKTLEDAVDEV